MNLYVYIEEGKINGRGTVKRSDNVINMEVSQSVYDNYEKYIYADGEIILNPDYEKEQAQRERERLDGLSMTRGDVFEAFILAKGLGKPQIRAMIEAIELDDVTKALYLNRFDEALNFYRGYPIFDILGEKLDITPEMLDRFFESGEWEELVGVNEAWDIDDETTPPDEKGEDVEFPPEKEVIDEDIIAES